MGKRGPRIIEALKEAARGDLARVTIGGQTWTRTKETDEEVSPYGEGYTHEAMHTTWVLMDTFEAHVMESRCAREYPEVAEAAEKVHQAMFDLYQTIGARWVDGPEDAPASPPAPA